MGLSHLTDEIIGTGNGDVRIGDFGLARPGDFRALATNKATDATMLKEIFTSFTTNVGTAFYIAPEVRSGTGKYDEKADMFSVGIILLEMSVPFATGMERSQTLTTLQKDGHPPPVMTDGSVRAQLFSLLIQDNPSQRPSSAELLANGDIPAQAEDESLRMARRLLLDHGSHLRSNFLSSFFSSTDGQDTDVYRDPKVTMVLLDDAKAMSRTSSCDMVLQRVVEEKLTTLFELHGAVKRTDNPALFPYHSYYAFDDVVKFLNPSGKVMQLPYDLILPNAMLLAQQVRNERRTFVFDNVYRANRFADEPKIFGEVNFDIVSTGGMNLALSEAETIKVLDRILDGFSHLSSLQMCYHVNHSRVLDAVLDYCNIEISKFAAVKAIISKLHTGDWTWAKVRHELRSPTVAIAALSLDELERFDFRDTVEEASTRLRSIMRDTFHLQSAFAHLASLTRYLNRFKVKRKVYFNPLSSYNEKFYRGNLLFQCLYDQKKRSVFAAGGRYDALIRDYQPIVSKRSHVHAVGFQLAWTGLCADMTAYLRKISKSKSKRRNQASLNAASYPKGCEVLINSFDHHLLESVGVEILLELQDNNISAKLAELNDSDSKESTYLRDEYVQHDHNWEILITSQDYVRVRNTNRDDETEIRTSELATHIRNELRERDRQDERITKAAFIRQGSQQDPESSLKDREIDIKVLMSQNKGKKVNRKTIVEEAQFHRRQYLQSCADSPIVAVETKDDVFESIAETRLSEPESWRKFIQSAAPGERQYLGQLQNLLKNMTKETAQGGDSTAIIYNFRTKACILYNLGRPTG